MPDSISVSGFVAETLEDYKAPTASTFTTRSAQCQDTVAAIEEATLGKTIILKDIVKVQEEMTVVRRYSRRGHQILLQMVMSHHVVAGI